MPWEIENWEIELLPVHCDLSAVGLASAICRYIVKYGESPTVVLFGEGPEDYVSDLSCQDGFFHLDFVGVKRLGDAWMVVGAEGAIGSGGA